MTDLKYTQGLCGDGAAILEDGQPLAVEQVLDRLRQHDQLCADLEKERGRVNKYLKVLSEISSACVGDLAMGVMIDANSIGQSIYEATGLTQPQLTALTDQGEGGE